MYILICVCGAVCMVLYVHVSMCVWCCMYILICVYGADCAC